MISDHVAGGLAATPAVLVADTVAPASIAPELRYFTLTLLALVMGAFGSLLRAWVDLRVAKWRYETATIEQKHKPEETPKP